jgi:hypothetical protein
MAAVLGSRVLQFISGDFDALTAAQKKDFTALMKIKKVVWLNPLLAGDTFSILDNAGKVIEQGRCEAANQSQIFAMDNWAQGISAINIVSGTIEIHLH